MAIRRMLVMAGLSLTVLGTSVTCSPEARRRALLLFCDGCPSPDAQARPRGYRVEATGIQSDGATTPIEPLRPARPLIAHAPYRDEHCGGCHSPLTGEVLRTPQQGLCRSCHPGVPGQARYVHGPVAVNDCLFCHHPHSAVYPKLLLTEPTELCFRCHNRGDLTRGAHHETVGEQACVECHNPHGGEHSLFLKRSDQ